MEILGKNIFNKKLKKGMNIFSNLKKKITKKKEFKQKQIIK